VVSTPRSYLLCGTPRTGSTLLCSLLASTGVAGRPESYFRQGDEAAWASRFGVAVAGDGSFDYREFVAAAVRAGTSRNGVFAARIMWGTLDVVVERLSRTAPSQRDLDVLIDAFGPLAVVHLRRLDVVGQAVSWARAEQTGYWQQGDTASTDARLDLDQIDRLVRTVEDHNAAWARWFAEQGVRPHVVTSEALVARPRRTVEGILEFLDLEPPSDWRPVSPHVRQADDINVDWARRYRMTRG
jgi:LPS sulfotransferase NodH